MLPGVLSLHMNPLLSLHSISILRRESTSLLNTHLTFCQKFVRTWVRIDQTILLAITKAMYIRVLHSLGILDFGGIFILFY